MHAEQSIASESSVNTMDTYCPSCHYCLCGLLPRGHCPECGTGFAALPDRTTAALSALQKHISLWPKAWPSTCLTDPETRWILRWKTRLTLAGLSVLFILGQLATTTIGFHIRPIRAQHGIHAFTSVAELRNMHDGRYVKIGSDAHWFGAWAFGGQVVAGLLIRSWYFVFSFRVRHDRKLFRKFGQLAATSVPRLFLGPISLVVLYQLLNAAVPQGDPWSPNWPIVDVLAYRLNLDVFGLLVVVLFTLFTIIWTIRFVIRHDRAMYELRLILGGAMPVPKS